MPKPLESKKVPGRAAAVITILCVCAACGVLTVGLWPFHAPRNNVHWLENKNGLAFDSYSTVLTDRPLHLTDPTADSFCSLEIWLAPGQAHKGNILAFADAGGSRVPFRLRQVGENLALEREVVDRDGRITTPWLTVDHVFRSGSAFVTITSSPEGTLVYVDGTLAKVSRSFGLQPSDFTGRLVLATSTINDSWTGQVTGLALYAHNLTRDQVAAHFATWQSAHRPTLADAGAAEALYLFNEHAGNVAHNELDPSTSLIIPAHYTVLHNPFLQPPWEHYRDRWSAAHYWPYWLDAAINIAGFVPVGFVFMALFFSVKPSRYPALFAILIGFALSLTIEVLQAFLPTRNSGMTDLITNTFGTALGAWFYRLSRVQHLWSPALGKMNSDPGRQQPNPTQSTPEESSIPA